MTKEKIAEVELTSNDRPEQTSQTLSDEQLAQLKYQADRKKRVDSFKSLTLTKKEALLRNEKLWFEIKLLEANLIQFHQQNKLPFVFGSNEGLIPDSIDVMMQPQPTAEQIAQAQAQAEAQAVAKEVK